MCLRIGSAAARSRFCCPDEDKQAQQSEGQEPRAVAELKAGADASASWLCLAAAFRAFTPEGQWSASFPAQQAIVAAVFAEAVPSGKSAAINDNATTNARSRITSRWAP
ncbi:MAG: hypothetical protein LC794_04445 [Acidobacteria bacterium]|nr:hypothetical protein [Acidobacteriota bacterium]